MNNLPLIILRASLFCLLSFRATAQDLDGSDQYSGGTLVVNASGTLSGPFPILTGGLIGNPVGTQAGGTLNLSGAFVNSGNGTLVLGPIGGGLSLPQNTWLGITSSGGRVERVGDSEVRLSAGVPLGPSGRATSMFTGSLIDSVSFDWALTTTAPLTPAQAAISYFLQDTGVELFTGVTLLESGSVRLTGLGVARFGFLLNVSDGGAQLAITNLSYTAIPEPSTYALLFAGAALIGAIYRKTRAPIKWL